MLLVALAAFSILAVADSETPAPAPAQQPAAETAVATPDAPPPAADGGKATPAELEVGARAAEEIEKEFKVLDDPAALERVVKIIQRLAVHTERPAMEYQPKILEKGGINAFALPGGFMYITKPLLEAVESEDELAAVIAHEMAHVCLKHGLDLARREAKMNSKLALAVIAAVLAGDNVDPGDVVLVGSLLKTGILSGYSREAETQADTNAVVYLHEAGYYPIAMLTVIQGLAHMELTRPYVELGIFQTHPDPQRRARAVLHQLTDMDVDLNPRLVLSTLQTKAESLEENGRTIGRVKLDDRVIFEPAVEADGRSPQQRAEKAATDLRRLILANLQMYEVRVVNGGARAAVLARGEPVVTVLPGDSEFHNASLDELAAEAAKQIKLALWEEAIRRAY